MRIRGIPLGEIKESDILELQSDCVLEDVVLEYKRAVPDMSTLEAKEEFAADVAAFANKSGGVILFGVEEHRTDKNLPTSKPKAFPGIAEDITVDALRPKVESILKSCVSPPILGVAIRTISVAGTTVLAIGITRSLIGPHMIGRDSKKHFVIRRNGFKDFMDVSEIKHAFLQLDSWEKQAEEFRRERIEGRSDERLWKYGVAERCCYLHLLPLGSDRSRVDLNATINHLKRFLPHGSNCHPTFNVDGVAMFQRMLPLGGEVVNCFRNGAIELEFQIPILTGKEWNSEKTIEAVNGNDLHSRVEAFYESYQIFAENMAITPPFLATMSLFGIAGLYCSGNPDGFMDFADAANIGKRFDRSPVLIPGVYIERLQDLSGEKESELLDLLWQSAGWPGNPWAQKDKA